MERIETCVVFYMQLDELYCQWLTVYIIYHGTTNESLFCDRSSKAQKDSRVIFSDSSDSFGVFMFIFVTDMTKTLEKSLLFR